MNAPSGTVVRLRVRSVTCSWQPHRRSSHCNGASRVGAEGSSTIKLTPPSLGKSIECLVVSCGPAQAPLKNPNQAMMTIWPAFPLSSGMPAGIHICEHTHCRKIRIPNNEPTQTSFEPSPTVCHPHCAMNLTATRRTFAHDAAPFRRRPS